MGYVTAVLCLYQLIAAIGHHKRDNDVMTWVNILGCLAWLYVTVKYFNT